MCAILKSEQRLHMSLDVIYGTGHNKENHIMGEKNTMNKGQRPCLRISTVPLILPFLSFTPDILGDE